MAIEVFTKYINNTIQYPSMTKTLYALCLVALFIVACQPTTINTTTQEQVSDQTLVKVTPAQLQAYLDGQTQETLRPLQSYVPVSPRISARPYADAVYATGAMESTKQSQTSQTNVQVQGIDEADIIKTYKDYVLVANGQVVTAIAKNATKVFTIANLSQEYYIQSLVIQNETVFVIVTKYSAQNVTTQINSYSLENQQPQLLQTYTVPGYYVQARVGENALYIVTQQTEYDTAYPWPIVYKGATSIQASDVRIMPYPHMQTASFTHIAKIEQEQIKATSIVSQGQPIVYMNTNGLLLAFNEYTAVWEIQETHRLSQIESYLTIDDKELIGKIQDVSNEILSASEKKWKISAVYSRAYERLDADTQKTIEKNIEEKTRKQLEQIESFSTTQLVRITTDLSQTMTQTIPGSVYGQFAIDWSKRSYKIATTQQAEWYYDTHKEETNNLYILDEQLQIISSIRDFASNESIYSVRYTPDYAYIVTYKQIDPLFVLDIANEQNPQIIGEVKIPGFSRYMHVINDSYILGIGQEEWSTLQISLFDVSDKKNPERVDVLTIKNAYSNVLYEHKALTIIDDLFAIPVSINIQTKDTPYAQYQQSYELLLLSVTDSLEQKGKVSHSTNIERSASVDDSLYTIGYNAVRVHNKTTLKPMGDVLIGFIDETGYDPAVQEAREVDSAK
jgi:inhibitor of cysteine peptidase